MKFRRIIGFLIAGMLLGRESVDACTTIIVSGKHTPDGRPLLWKNRDTDSLQNIVMFFQDGKYEYIGLVDAFDRERKNVWTGCNSAGFAIMNSHAYNLNTGDTIGIKDNEGRIMKKALQTCATLDDFEKLLKDWPKPMGASSNFGVIDAQGGAAFFETDNFKFVKLDADDPAQAPMGYIIHTNFSYTGDSENGKGYIRYFTAENIFQEAKISMSITPRFILQEAARSLRHSLTRTDLKTLNDDLWKDALYVPYQDYISRYYTSASVVIQGVKPGMPSDLATMWTVLGFPLTSVVVPAWVAGGKDLPKMISADKDSTAPLCRKALQLKERVIPTQKEYQDRYLNPRLLYNSAGNGIMQKLRPLEDLIFEETDRRFSEWTDKRSRKEEIQKFYKWLDDTIGKEYQSLYNI
jgi:hypothetical protein